MVYCSCTACFGSVCMCVVWICKRLCCHWAMCKDQWEREGQLNTCACLRICLCACGGGLCVHWNIHLTILRKNRGGRLQLRPGLVLLAGSWAWGASNCDAFTSVVHYKYISVAFSCHAAKTEELSYLEKKCETEIKMPTTTRIISDSRKSDKGELHYYNLLCLLLLICTWVEWSSWIAQLFNKAKSFSTTYCTLNRFIYQRRLSMCFF